jgi:hypothetical protein
VLGIEFRASCRLGKCSITELPKMPVPFLARF